MILGMMLGPVKISFFDNLQILGHKILGFSPPENSEQHILILWEIRFPRILLGAFVGIALSLSGVLVQGIFHNPLADPYLLGIASGGTMGAAFVVCLGGQGIFLPAGSLIGAWLAVFLVYGIVRKRNMRNMQTSLLLAGIAISTLFSACTSFLIFFAHPNELRQIIFWIMGSLAGATWKYILPLFIVICTGSITILFFGRALNAMSLGDETAWHLGIDPSKLHKILLALATFLTASVVCIVGTVGFVGLVIPHILRLILGPDHRWLLPCAALGGASFVILCDTAARTILSPQELPIGMITALFGVPFFLFLLIKNQSR